MHGSVSSNVNQAAVWTAVRYGLRPLFIKAEACDEHRHPQH